MPAVKRVLVEISGWAFVVLGIAGLFLPVLQGILFLLVGLTILSLEHHWARRWIAKLLKRFPKAERSLRKFLGKHSKLIPGLDSPSVRQHESN
jgi:uncharacterized membrane protein YbaN (DUF454 family)